MTPIDMGEKDYVGCHLAAHSVFVPLQYKDFYTFSSVRNPYARELSKYNWMKRKPSPITRDAVFEKYGNIDFLSYIEWICDNERTNKWENNVWKESQVDTLYRQPVPAGCKEIDYINQILKCETLAVDFLTLPFVQKEQANQIKSIFNRKINSSQSQKNALRTFEKAAKKRFYDRFKEDFVVFDYDPGDCPLVNSIKHLSIVGVKTPYFSLNEKSLVVVDL